MNKLLGGIVLAGLIAFAGCSPSGNQVATEGPTTTAPAPRRAPPYRDCDETWQEGAILPAGYTACRDSDGDVSYAAGIECADGTFMHFAPGDDGDGAEFLYAHGPRGEDATIAVGDRSKVTDCTQSADDVNLDACGGEFGTLKAHLTIVNNSSETRDYVVEVEWLDTNGVRFSEAFIEANNVAPGEVVREVAVSADEAADDGAKCNIADVERFAS